MLERVIFSFLYLGALIALPAMLLGGRAKDLPGNPFFIGILTLFLALYGYSWLKLVLNFSLPFLALYILLIIVISIILQSKILTNNQT